MKTLFNLLIVSVILFIFCSSVFAQTTYSWVGGTGDWNVRTNWSPFGIPGVLDSANINSGTATLTDNVTIAKLELSATLSGDSSLLVTNIMNWGGGTMQGSGTTNITAGATLRLSGGNQQTLVRNLVNNGTTIWEAGNFYLAGGITFTNNGTFLDQHSGTEPFSGGTSGCTFINDGSYTKTGTGLSQISLGFYNNDSLEIQNGSLQLNSWGNSNGTITVESGAVLRVQGSSSWNISGPVSGEGTVEFWTATTIQNTYNITGSTLFASNTTIFDTSATIISLNHGQELVISGRAEFNTGDPVSIDSMYLTGYLQGSDSVSIIESMNWAAGTAQGSGTLNITTGATLRLSGGNQQTLTRNLVNDGTTIWEAGNFYLGGGITLTNNGSFLDQHSSSQTFSGGINGCTFINNGIYTKTGTGLSQISLGFYNNDSLEIQNGSLQLNSWGNSNGTITVESGAVLRVQGSSSWNISGPVSGEGTVEFWTATTIQNTYNITGSTLFASNTTIFDTSATIISLNHGQELVISGRAEFNTGDPVSIDSMYFIGYLQGSDSVSIIESMNWAAGTAQGSGTLNITTGATLRLSGGNQQTLTRNLVNDGTTIWEAGNFYLGGGITLTNNGSFLDQHSSSQTFSGGINGCTFINNGIYTKNSAGTSGITIPFYNNVSGHIRGTGSMSITYGFTNEGLVSPGDSLGTLNLTVDYPTTSTSDLNIEIGGTTVDSLYDQLNITGTATLGGTLNISLVNSFIPALGNTFEILTYSSYTGNFNTINGLNTGTGVSFDMLTSPTSIKLATINSPNNPPVVVNQISNILLDEDFGSVTVANLDTIFDDSDIPLGDSLTYSFSVLNGLLNASITGNELQIHSVSDSNGVASVIVIATDTSLASVNDTFEVNINPINDAPAIFNILEPQDGVVLTSADTLDFLWQNSFDVDNDPLVFELRIFGASWDTTINSIADTAFEYLDNGSLQLNTTYQWTVSVFDGLLSVASTDTFSFTTPQPNGMDDIDNQNPKKFALKQNYPNPFNPTTTIAYDLPKASHVKIEVYNLLGKKVKTILDESKDAGNHKFVFNSNNLASGVYFYRIQASTYTNSKKMILLR